MSQDASKTLPKILPWVDGPIVALFQAEADRVSRFTHRVGGLSVDLSKQQMSEADRTALIALARARGVEQGLTKLFNGAIVNTSENRPALHWLVRAPLGAIPTALQEFAQRNAQTQARMREIVAAIHSQSAASVGLIQPLDVVNLGIGGSDLGPRLVVEALAPFCHPSIRTHFVANVDGYAMHTLLQKLDPKRTLFIVASKSFNTHETLLNARVARAWLTDSGVTEAHVSQHFLAVSANVAGAVAFGMRAENVLAMFDSVGGRYSLWSAVGLSAAIALGWQHFSDLLAGAHAMDQHVQQSDLQANLAVHMALVAYHNANVLKLATQAVVSYDERLFRLPEFLQQLEMESNGKSVAANGAALEQGSAPVTWGGLGTNVQHAFFQAIHQGTQRVPIDFIGVIKAAHPHAENHAVLLANLLAQSAALLMGKSEARARAELPADMPADAADALARQKAFSGNRPSTTILLDDLNPHSLGELLALYEHKTYVLSLLWGVNCFDQWGVELGKTIAVALLPALQDPAQQTTAASFDPSTLALIRRIRAEQ
jgi:glucose-6-phosphate isomerase